MAPLSGLVWRRILDRSGCGLPFYVKAGALPAAGSYRIQNSGTGYYMDASGSGQSTSLDDKDSLL